MRRQKNALFDFTTWTTPHQDVAPIWKDFLKFNFETGRPRDLCNEMDHVIFPGARIALRQKCWIDTRYGNQF